MMPERTSLHEWFGTCPSERKRFDDESMPENNTAALTAG
jgi:hypothetical protein